MSRTFLSASLAAATFLAQAPSGRTCIASDMQSAKAPYAVSGYWLYSRHDAESWRRALTRVRRVGADTVIQFGPRLRRTTLDAVRKHPAWAGRRELFALQAAGLNPKRLRRVFVFQSWEDYGDALVVRPGVDVRVERGDRVMWRLAFPAANPSDRTVDLTRAAAYDLVFVAGRRKDSVAMLLAEADQLGMRVFVGMPAAPRHPKYPWDPWGAAMPTFLEFADRVLESYARRFGALHSFAGVYQSLETPITGLRGVFACYRAQHARVRRILPDRKILVSPYWDARKRRRTGAPPERAKKGVQAIARCDVDIIAPQDSRGTGKVGLFWPHEADQPADKRLQPVPGVKGLTYGQAYYGSTRDYFRAVREGLDELAAKEGIRVELWANLEAFEPGKGVPCGSFRTTQRTTKERLDQAVMFAGPYPSKLISYMWDSYYTCRAGREKPLGEEIEADWRRPIIVDAFRSRRRGRLGLTVLGYNLAHAALEISAGAGAVVSVRVAEEDADLSFGSERARYPARLQQVWAPYAGAGGRLRIWARGPGGRCFHAFVLAE